MTNSLSKNANYPKGVSLVGYNITPANGLGSGVKGVHKSGVAAGICLDTTQQAAASLSCGGPISNGPVLNYIDTASDSGVRGRANGDSILGE